MPNFEESEVWKRSCRLASAIYKCMQDCRDASFKDQINRSSVIFPGTIAESFAQQDTRNACNYLCQAKGAAGVLYTQIHIGMDVGHIPKDIGTMWKNEITQLTALLNQSIEPDTEA